jgi:hypothetical protein
LHPLPPRHPTVASGGSSTTTRALFNDSEAAVLGDAATICVVLPAVLQAVTSNAPAKATRTVRIDARRCDSCA